MEYEDEYSEFCLAFDEMYNTIKEMKNSENNLKSQNQAALEKCKQEIESLIKGDGCEISS